MRTLLSLALLCTLTTHAADSAPDPAAMQAMMEQVSKTGAEHVALAQMVGTWTVQSSTWMAPGAPPEVSQGTATCTALFGGKWIRQEYSGSMMGQPYLGIGLNGYDTVAKQYVSTWCDSFSTMLTTMIGTSSDGGKTIVYTSEMPHCPMAGGPMHFRYVLAHASPDRMVFTMYQTAKDLPEHKGMELIYTRQAAAR